MTSNLAERVSALSGAQRRDLLIALGVSSEPAAISGMGVRLPQITGPLQFRTRLADPTPAISPVPAERWSAAQFPSGLEAWRHHAGVTHAGLLADHLGFDRSAFLISEREVAAVDPQQRLALEVTLEALEDAGLPLEQVMGRNIGVYFGASTNDHARGALQAGNYTPFTTTGGALASIAARIAYELDLHGPSIVVDCACASSAVALHMAAQALSRGEIETAIVGGVNIVLNPDVACTLAAAGLLSKSGGCRPFDRDADGFVRGEGAVVLVLRRLADAKRAGDRIYASILGSAVNQGGRSNGFASPNPAAQASVIRQALAAAGVDPASLTAIETSGTGTPLGDAIELGAINHAVQPRQAPLVIGALKGWLGHLEAASGLAAVAKTCLVMADGAMPRQAGLSALSEAASKQDLLLFPLHGPLPIAPGSIVGVNSFGIGGTNCHIVLKAPDQDPVTMAPDQDAVPTSANDDDGIPIFVSARNPAALQRRIDELLAWLRHAGSSVRLADLAKTLARRTHYRSRAAFITSDLEDLCNQLERWEPPSVAERTVGSASVGANGFDNAPSRAEPATVSERQSVAFAEAAAHYEAGFNVDFGSILSGGQLISLPPSPWDRQHVVRQEPVNAILMGEHSKWTYEIEQEEVMLDAAEDDTVAAEGAILLDTPESLRAPWCDALSNVGVTKVLRADSHGSMASAERIVLVWIPDLSAAPPDQAAGFLQKVGAILTANAGLQELVVVTTGAATTETTSIPGFPGRVAEALVRAFPFDLPHVRCRWIDLATGSENEVTAAARLIRSGPDEDTVFICGMDARAPRLVARPALGHALNRAQIDPSHPYLIVGVGPIESALTLALAEAGARTLVVLADRATVSTLEDGLTERWPALDLRCIDVDLTNEDDVAKKLRPVLATLPPLAAAIFRADAEFDGDVTVLSSKAVAVFSREAARAWALHRLLPDDASLLVIGSMLSVLGAPDSAVATAVEAFCCGLAVERRARGGSGEVFAWGPWADPDATAPDSFITLAPAAEAAALTLALPHGRSVPLPIIPFDLVALLRGFPRGSTSSLVRNLLAGDTPVSPKQGYRRPDLACDFVEARSEVEAAIAAIWRRALALDRVGVLDDFFALGGDSVVGGQIIDSINDMFDIEMTTEVAFSAFTVDAMAQVVEEALLLRVTSLSEEDLDRALGQGSAADDVGAHPLDQPHTSRQRI